MAPIRGTKIAVAPSSRVLRSRTWAVTQSADISDASQAGTEDAVPMSSARTSPRLTPVLQCGATPTITTTTTAVSSVRCNITTVNKVEGEVWSTKMAIQ